jgi:guanyl-specific ribonuclease Sa
MTLIEPRLGSKAVPRVRRPLLALIVLIVALGIGYAVKAADDSSSSGSAKLRTVALSSLPPQAAVTVRLIERGGPFPYPHNDGVVFHNAEGHLPKEPDGYYREYTVPTPGADTRGARRIITGRAGTFYYTGDHYESFVKVDVQR